MVFQQPHMRRELIHGFYANFDESLRHTGVRYLRDDLQYQEAKTFFDKARLTGHAYFEDDLDHDYTLAYNRADNTYTLMPRKTE